MDLLISQLDLAAAPSHTHRFNPITTLYYIAPLASCFLSVPFLLMEVNGTMQFLAKASGLWHFFLNATNAFALNLAVFLLLGRTSALTMNVCGLVKDWFTIAGGGYRSRFRL